MNAYKHFWPASTLSIYTKEVRLDIYKHLIKGIDTGNQFSLCPTITGMCGLCAKDLPKGLPELWQQRPKHITSAVHSARTLWYPVTPAGMQQRKQSLLKAIQLCETSLS